MDPLAAEELRRLRDSLDNIDSALVHLLAERFKVRQKVGQFKAEHRLPPMDPERESHQVARLRALAAEAGLDPQNTEAYLDFVVRLNGGTHTVRR
jgi:chorismate mutase